MLKSSVGNQGTNNKSEVLHVQKALNQHSFAKTSSCQAPLKEDGVCGGKTVSAIIRFQSVVVGMAPPDGRIDPGGRTLKVLEKSSGGISHVPIVAGVGIKVSSPKTGTKSGGVTAVATSDTDPRKLKTRGDIASVYGAITEDKKWAKQSQFLVSYTVPTAIQQDKSYNWINVYSPKKNKVTIVYCHKAMHKFLDAALKNLLSRNLLGELKEFGGSHAIRATRGTTNWSAHSWALAIDINMTGNGLGETPKMSKEFAQCFIDAGFGWGGNYTRKDGMHFTIAGFDMPRV